MIRPRILLADDHLEFLEAEIVFLRSHFEVVGTASDGASLVSEAERLNPEVIVVDITIPVISPLAAATAAPLLPLLLTIFSPEELIMRIIKVVF